jgi:hypothetical protein
MATGVKIDSNPSASAAEYDAWLDINDDGIINMLDIYYPALSYGATGDPTKFVAIANLSTYEWTLKEYQVNPEESVQVFNSSAGFRRVTVTAWQYPNVHMEMGVSFGNSEAGVWAPRDVIQLYDYPDGFSKTYEVTGSMLHVYFYLNEPTGSAWLDVYIYMTI